MSSSTPSLESIICSDQVPTLPEVAVEVLRVAQQPNPSLDELTRVIRMDPAIAGRIVKFANSPLFGIRRTEATIESAVVMLGTTMIRTLVLGFSLASRKASAPSIRPHFQRVWRETLFQAVAAEVLGERHKNADPAVWFLAALLQDAGRLVMLNVFQGEYVDLIQDESDSSLCERECQAFGFSHADVSAALCRSWNLGGDLVEAVARHHEPLPTSTDGPISVDQALQSVGLCNDYMEAVVGRPTATRDAVEQNLIETHHCRPDEVVELLAEVDCRARAMAAVLKADVGEMPSREALLEQAQATLLKIAIAEQLRRLNGEAESVNLDSLESEESSWLDSDTGAFSEGLLERILPEELADSSDGEKTLGLLSVELRNGEDRKRGGDLRCAAEVIRQCVRPGDRLVRHGESGLLVVLPKLSMNMLARVGRRIAEQASALLEDTNVQVVVGGLMVIPAGRKVATLDSVLGGLKKSLQAGRDEGPAQFQVLQGRKLAAVPMTE